MVKTSTVWYGSMIHGQAARYASLGAKFDEMIKQLDFCTIGKGDKVALKMHMGFEDDFQTVPVFFVRKIVKAVKEAGGYPFVTDNPTEIYNAAERGYTSETCGCPLIPIAGVKDRYVYHKDFEFGDVGDIHFAGVLHDADVLIDVAHSKGHAVSSYSGAIKNLALGGLAAGSRWHKMHGVENTVKWWNPEKCSPEHVSKLVKSCPHDALKYDEKKQKLSIILNSCSNTNCLKCIKADEGVGCIEIKPEFFQAFNRLMALTTEEILSHFDKDKRFYFNFAMDITPQCNCLGMIQPQIVPDIGITASRDICAVEQATLDLIGRATFLSEMVPPYINDFSDNSKLHPFQRIFGSMKNPYDQVRFAEELGLGTTKYRLIEILPPAVTAKMQPPKLVYEGAPTFY